MIVLMGVVGLAAWNSGTNLLYLLLATMIGMFLTHGIFALNLMNGLVCRRHVPPEAPAGEPVPITVTLTNQKRFLPTFAVNIRNRTDDGVMAGLGFCATIRPRETIEVPVPAIFPHRGWFVLGRLDVFSRFPFGFTERGYTIREDQRILILPPTFPAEDIALEFGLESGDAVGQAKGVGVEPHSLRDYTQGEHVRNIHWKTSARLGRPVVLEYVVEETRQVCLTLIAVPESGGDWDERLEKAVVLTASLAVHLIKAGYEVGLICGSESIPPGHGSSHSHAILRTLAGIDFQRLSLERISEAETVRTAGMDSRSLVVEILYARKDRGEGSDTSYTVKLWVDDWELVRGEWRQSEAFLKQGESRDGTKGVAA